MSNKRWLVALAACGALALPSAEAKATEGEEHLPAVLSPSLSTGVAVIAFGYSQYQTGFSARALADRSLPTTLHQRVGAALSVTRFTIDGATLDLGAAEATYRIYPVRPPFFVAASAGLLVSREAFDVSLARGRRIDDVHVRLGLPVGLGVGVTLFRHVDLEAGYRQTLFFGGEGPTTFGHASFALGGRF